MRNIYLDNNASTPVDPAVVSCVVEVLEKNYGNPSSAHSIGKRARALITNARASIAEFLGVKPKELVFTSGATEAINLILKGLFEGESGHLITTDVEHSSVYNCARYLEAKGCSVTYLRVGAYGAPKPADVAAAITPKTKAIALMAVNNETGVITDIEAIAKIAKERSIPLIVDAVAWIGKTAVQVPEGVMALCFSGHKIHAPKGVGFAYINKKLKVKPQLLGGEHEMGMRAGTENVTGIVGMAKAFELLALSLPEAERQMQRLRDRFEEQLLKRLPGIAINGEGPRICNCSNIAFMGCEGEVLLAKLDMAGVSCSHGSACSSGALQPSRILTNMGYPKERILSSLRFSLSRETKEEEIDEAVRVIVSIVESTKRG